MIGERSGNQKMETLEETEIVVLFNGPDVTDILNLYKFERELVQVQHTTLGYLEPRLI